MEKSLPVPKSPAVARIGVNCASSCTCPVGLSRELLRLCVLLGTQDSHTMASPLSFVCLTWPCPSPRLTVFLFLCPHMGAFSINCGTLFSSCHISNWVSQLEVGAVLPFWRWAPTPLCLGTHAGAEAAGWILNSDIWWCAWEHVWLWNLNSGRSLCTWWPEDTLCSSQNLVPVPFVFTPSSLHGS